MDEQEIWKPLPEDCNYEVSNFGRVRSRIGKNGIPLRPDEEWRICKLTPHCKGYLQVSINNRLRLVHDLVLTAHVRPPTGDEQACHYPDTCKTNNKLENLSWGTRARNMQDVALTRGVKGQKLTVEKVLAIRNVTDGKVLDRELLTQVSAEFQVSPAAVKNIRYRQTWAWLDDRIQQ